MSQQVPDDGHNEKQHLGKVNLFVIRKSPCCHPDQPP